MKSAVFNKDSWHYSLATELGGFPKYENDTNICQYSRSVATGAGVAALLIALFLGAIYWTLITIVWWVVILQYGFFEATGPMVLSAVVMVGGVAVFIMEGVPRLFKYLGRKVKGPVQTRIAASDSFAAKSWRSFHDKTCFTVKLVKSPDNDD